MAFQSGTTVDPRLMQADYSGFARVGEIEGQAMANIGQSVASGIEGYKKRKKEQNAGKARIKRAEALGDSMIAMVKDKNPDLANSIAETMSMNFDEGVPFAQRMEATEGFEQSLMNMFLMDQKNQGLTTMMTPSGTELVIQGTDVIGRTPRSQQSEGGGSFDAIKGFLRDDEREELEDLRRQRALDAQ